MPGDTRDALNIKHAAAGHALPLIHGLRLNAEPTGQDGLETDGLDGLTETFSAHALIQSTTLNDPSSGTKQRFVDQVRPMGENSTMASKQELTLTPREKRMAANLRKLREHNRMTLDDVGSALGVTNQAVNQYEKEKSRIGEKRIPAILHLFGVYYGEFTGELIGDDDLIKIDARKEEIADAISSGGLFIDLENVDYVASPRLFDKPIEEPSFNQRNDLESNIAEQFDGLRIEGEVAAGRWIEVHGDIDGDLAHHDIYDNVPVALDHRWPKAAQYGLIVRGTSINNVAIDGDVLTCVGLHETSYRLREYDLVIVEQRRDAGLLIERTAKRWMEHVDRFELWPDSSDPRWQTPIIVPKQIGLDVENDDGISISVKAFVTWIHRPVQVPVRRKR